MKKHIACFLLGTVSCAPALHAQTALTAQSTLTTPAAKSIDPGDIVVTARRENELLQQTPVAVTAITADALAKQSVGNVSDLGRIAPNLSLRTGGGSQGQAFIFIRGIGQFSDDPSLEQGVALYVDDVYMPRSQGALFDLSDVQQIEVLRGPQGTLYGKNAVGGAIKITSRLPDDTDEIAARLSYGNFNETRLNMSLNHVLVDDKLFLRLSMGLHKRDGTTDNAGIGGPVNDVETVNGRIMLRYKPTETLDMLWSSDVYRDRSHMANQRLVAYDPEAPLGPLITATYGSLAPYLWHDGTDPDKGAAYNVVYDRNIGMQPFQNVWGTSFRTTWTGDAVTLQSITAYRTLDNVRILDLDGSPYTVLHVGDRTRQNQFSEELQADGNLFNHALHYFGGLFFFRERIFHDIRQSIPLVDANTDRTDHVGTDSYAAYANLRWEPTRRFSLTLGGRYTSEKRLLTTIETVTGTDTVLLGPVSRSKIFNNFSPKIEADYKLTPDIFTYASFSRGFKSGGFNSEATTAAAVTPYNPEKASSYEVGVKSSLFDHKLIFNVAAFYTNYDDLQETVFTSTESGPLRTVTNAAKARIQGVEIETTLRPMPNLTLSGSFGLTDAKYNEFDDPTEGDFTANALPLISKYNYTLAGEYQIPLAGEQSIDLRADWAWRSLMYTDIQNTPQISQPGYGILDARIAWKLKDGIELAVYSKNLTDERAIQSASSALDPFGIAWAYFNDPRTYGVEASIKF